MLGSESEVIVRTGIYRHSAAGSILVMPHEAECAGEARGIADQVAAVVGRNDGEVRYHVAHLKLTRLCILILGVGYISSPSVVVEYQQTVHVLIVGELLDRISCVVAHVYILVGDLLDDYLPLLFIQLIDSVSGG